MSTVAFVPVSIAATVRCARCRGPHRTDKCEAPFLRHNCSTDGCTRSAVFVRGEEVPVCGPCRRAAAETRRREEEELDKVYADKAEAYAARCRAAAERRRRQLVCATFPEGSKPALVEAAMRAHFEGCGAELERCEASHKLGMAGIATFKDEAAAQAALAWAREGREHRLFFAGKHVCIFARADDDDSRSVTSSTTAPTECPTVSTVHTEETAVEDHELLPEDLKEVRKWEKKLRELAALESRKAAGEKLQANQEAKLAGKDDLQLKLCSARRLAQVRAARAVA